jgi:hypothetical protein
MATLDEQNKLVEVLKFTPRTYKIMLWGYGGEYVMGTVERKIYDYFKQRRLSVSDYAWGGDETDIPEEMQPFPPGSWYECSDMCHTSGVDRNSGTIQIDDENGETIYQKSTEDLDGYSDDSPEWSCNEEVWIDEKDPGTVVFIGVSNEKGTFFEADLELTQPFDATKLTLIYDEVDGNEIINRIEYDGVELDNYGGDTSGKSSDFGFYIAGSQKDGNWEKYKDMDDIEYSLTEWFPAKINPVHLGKYNVKTKDGYNYQAMWNGEFWHNDWSEEKIQVKEWQGIDHDPDADWDPVAELDKIEIPETLQQKAVWPYAAGSVPADVMEKAMTEEKETISKWWTVRTYYKKSCEQHEYFVQSEGTGRIKVIDGFRSCTYNVETNDGEFPKFEFTYVPGGNGDKDSLDLNNLYGDNIESAELVEMFDGGCWGDNEITGIDDEEEVERLEEFLSENGSYALEDEGEWYLDETEVWVWGPLEVTDEDGNTRIVIADENGNMVDFKE